MNNHENPNLSPQKIRVKGRTVNKAVLNHPDQFAIHMWETKPLAKYFRVTRTCNSGVSLRKPVRLLIAIALSMLTITRSSRLNLNFRKMYLSSNVSIKRMASVLKKVRFPLCIRVSKTLSVVSSHLHPALTRTEMSEEL